MSVHSRPDFIRDAQGAVFVEAILILPALMIFSIVLLEFSNVMWEREQLQVGLRDAARYWSRCRVDVGGLPSNCSEATARNIAFYGNPDGTGPLRVPGWDAEDEIVILPAKAALPSNAALPADPADMEKVSVSGSFTYEPWPGFEVLLDEPMTIGHRVEMRFIGW